MFPMFLSFFNKLLQGPYDVVVLPGGNLGAQNLCEVNARQSPCLFEWVGCFGLEGLECFLGGTGTKTGVAGVGLSTV